MATKKIFIIAGEASGDNLGAKLVKALKQESKDELIIHGICGPRMIEEGVIALHHIKMLSVMGFFEVLPQIPRILKLINNTVNYIKEFAPDLVITIDAPDLSFRIASAVKEFGIKLLHYVAPTVWAYREGRAKKIAKIYDHLLVLLPFEPPYFTREGLDCTFVGHPIIEDFPNIDKVAAKAHFGIGEDEFTLLLMPGSRKGEIQNLLPIFLTAALKIQSTYPKLKIIIPNFLHFKNLFTKHLDNMDNIILTTDPYDKIKALYAADFGLVKSGTATLEAAMAKLPMVVAYRVNPLTALLLKPMLKIQQFNLINILLGKNIIPELIQGDCNQASITNKILELQNPQLKSQMLESYDEALKMIGFGSTPTPSQKAAKVVIDMLN